MAEPDHPMPERFRAISVEEACTILGVEASIGEKELDEVIVERRRRLNNAHARLKYEFLKELLENAPHPSPQNPCTLAFNDPNSYLSQQYGEWLNNSSGLHAAGLRSVLSGGVFNPRDDDWRDFSCFCGTRKCPFNLQWQEDLRHQNSTRDLLVKTHLESFTTVVKDVEEELAVLLAHAKEVDEEFPLGRAAQQEWQEEQQAIGEEAAQILKTLEEGRVLEEVNKIVEACASFRLKWGFRIEKEVLGNLDEVVVNLGKRARDLKKKATGLVPRF